MWRIFPTDLFVIASFLTTLRCILLSLSVLTNTADYVISWRIYYNNANKRCKSIYCSINQIQSEAANYCKYNRNVLLFLNVVPKGSMKGNLSLLLRILKLTKQYQCFRPEHTQPPSTCSKFIYYCVQITGRLCYLWNILKYCFVYLFSSNWFQNHSYIISISMNVLVSWGICFLVCWSLSFLVSQLFYV